MAYGVLSQLPSFYPFYEMIVAFVTGPNIGLSAFTISLSQYVIEMNYLHGHWSVRKMSTYEYSNPIIYEDSDAFY